VLTVNAETNEIGGVFLQTQPSDTDMGSKVPKTLLLKGKFFAALGN
jgi:photosystem II oxygen-evolving enhancer protein 1